MEEDGCHDEEAKDDNLREKTSDNDPLSSLVELQRSSRLDAAPACLEGEGDHIARHEDTSHPSDRYQRKTISTEGSDETAEDHVDRSSVESRGDEDEDCLDNEAADGDFVVMAPYPATVPNGLDCLMYRLAASHIEKTAAGDGDVQSPPTTNGVK